ncbi:MAG: PilW family protein [Proteobacteria bacterium]|nr:PilW family protein [Pseudomonadota bacterium]
MLFRKNNGVSLIELIISMALGVGLIAASLQAFLVTKQVFIKQNAIARIQENARIIHFILGRAIAASGNLGCNAFSPDLSIVNLSEVQSDNIMLMPPVKLMGVKYSELQNHHFLSQKTKNRIKPNTDILLIKGVKEPVPISSIDYALKSIKLNGTLKVKPNQLLAMSDCAQVIFARALSSEQLKGNSQILFKAPVNQQHDGLLHHGMVGLFSSQLFYIGDTGRLNANGAKIEALYTTDLNGRTLELVEGVEQMNISYGIAHETVTYVPQEQVSDWFAVSKVRISLLLNSIEDVQNLINPKNRLLKIWWHFEWSIKT